MLFVRAFVVPAPVKVLVAEIAGASMFIYLTHYQMISLVKKVTGEHMPWVSLILSIIGGVIGGQFGANAGQKLKGEQLRVLLALIVLAVAIRMLVGLLVTPDDLFSLSPLVGGS